MIAFIHCLSFLVIAITAGYLLKVTLSDMLPFVWCGLVLVLYVLSFGRLLNLIDVLMPLAAVGLTCYAWRRGAYMSGRSASDAESSAGGGRLHCPDGLVSYVKENITSAGFITYVILCITIPLTQSARIVTWWDDINYWASDLKSLYRLHGFADKYTNVSSAFGDYPPGIQLAKWYLVHMNRRGFSEPLAFAGYYLFNLAFIMPLFKRIKGAWAIVLAPLLALAAWGFAGIGDIYGYSGFCADLSMAFLFGSVLIGVVSHDARCARYDVSGTADKDTASVSSDAAAPVATPRAALFTFPDLCICVYLAVLVIAKSTGMIWAFFACIVLVVYRLLDVTHVTKQSVLRSIAPLAGPLLTGISWMGFCLLRRRVTQTTSTMVTYITTDDYGLSPYKNEFGAAFIRAFFTEPVHVTHTWIDLPPAAMLVLITVLLILCRRFGMLRGRAGTFMCIALPVFGLIYYAVIYVAHLTIFATETQYLEAKGMIASIERYGAPFVIGCMLFIAGMWMEGTPADGATADGASADGATDPDHSLRLRIRVFLLAVLVLTNIPEAYRGLLGYRWEVEEQAQTREDTIDDQSADFIDCLRETTSIGAATHAPDWEPAVDLGGGLRVCRVRDGAYYRVQDTYVGYEVSPVSVLCPSMDIKDTPEDAFIAAVSATHATYVYVDWQPYEDTYLDAMTADGDFEYDTLYRISYEGGMMRLEEVGR